MTDRTIRLIDRYCDVWNWQQALEEALAWQTKLDGGSARDRDLWATSCVQEVKGWRRRLGRSLANLRLVMSRLTDHEKDWVRRECGGDSLAQEFRKLGVEPNWADADGSFGDVQ